MTVLLRVNCQTDRFPDLDEVDEFCAWLRTIPVVPAIDPIRVMALAVEAPGLDGPDQTYLLHLAEYQCDATGRLPAYDPATNSAKLAYRTVALTTWTWPNIRAISGRLVVEPDPADR